MADTKIQFYPVADAATCQFTGISFSVATARAEPLPARVFITNVGVSQDPTAPLRRRVGSSRRTGNATAPSVAPPRRRRAPPRHLARRVASDADGDGVADAEITRTIVTSLRAGQNTLGWGSDVPEGYYIVSAAVDDATINYEVTVSPRFFVRQEGRGTDCLSTISVDASAALQPAASSTTSLSATSAPTDATPDTRDGHRRGPLPVAAIVGVAIAASVLLILLVLVCVWNRRQQTKPLSSSKRTPSPPAAREAESSFFVRDRGTFVQTRTAGHYVPASSSPAPPVPPLPRSTGRR